MVLEKDIQIRAFLVEDIEALVSYWTESTEEYWRTRGIDKSKLLSKEQFTEHYQKSFRENGEINTIAIILFKNLPVGVHTLTSVVENESALFHAHIWKEEHRQIGIGSYSYIKASEYFLEKLQLEKIIFKTPVINIGANRVKEKLGIPCLGKTVFEASVLIAPLDVYLYELDRNLLEKIKLQRIKLASRYA